MDNKIDKKEENIIVSLIKYANCFIEEKKYVTELVSQKDNEISNIINKILKTTSNIEDINKNIELLKNTMTERDNFLEKRRYFCDIDKKYHITLNFRKDIEKDKCIKEK